MTTFISYNDVCEQAAEERSNKNSGSYEYDSADFKFELGNINNSIVAEWRGKYTEHRICGSVIVGVMIPKDLVTPDFQFNDPMRIGKHYLGKKIDIPQPKTHFEYRGIYELKETNLD